MMSMVIWQWCKEDNLGLKFYCSDQNLLKDLPKSKRNCAVEFIFSHLILEISLLILNYTKKFWAIRKLNESLKSRVWNS